MLEFFCTHRPHLFVNATSKDLWNKKEIHNLIIIYFQRAILEWNLLFTNIFLTNQGHFVRTDLHVPNQNHLPWILWFHMFFMVLRSASAKYFKILSMGRALFLPWKFGTFPKNKNKLVPMGSIEPSSAWEVSILNTTPTCHWYCKLKFLPKAFLSYFNPNKPK